MDVDDGSGMVVPRSESGLRNGNLPRPTLTSIQAMSVEIEEVQAWLFELNQVSAAALLGEASFEYRLIDVAFSIFGADDGEVAIVELDIRVPPRIYKEIRGGVKDEVNQVEAAICELGNHRRY
jgi:hypothetical protein